MDRWIEQQTDGRTNKVTYRVTCTRLKIKLTYETAIAFYLSERQANAPNITVHLFLPLAWPFCSLLYIASILLRVPHFCRFCPPKKKLFPPVSIANFRHEAPKPKILIYRCTDVQILEALTVSSLLYAFLVDQKRRLAGPRIHGPTAATT